MAVAAEAELQLGVGRPRPAPTRCARSPREHNLVPVRHTFLEDCETPVSAFLKLRGAGPAFLLESAEQGQRVGPLVVHRLPPAPGAALDARRRRRSLRARRRRGAAPPPGAAAATCRRSPAARWASSATTACARSSAGRPNPDPVGLPDLALMLTDALVAFDHLKHTVTILANAYVEEEGVEAAYERARG